MLNIIILIEPTKYSYHTTISHMIKSTLHVDKHIISVIDINSYKQDYECLNQIKELHPDVLITLDLSGFRFRTQAGETALNMFPTKNLNLLWGNKAEYTPFLNKKLSLSMLFYDVSGTNGHLAEIYPNLLYYKTCEPLSPTRPNTSQAKEVFSNIWADFTKEVLLYQT